MEKIIQNKAEKEENGNREQMEQKMDSSKPNHINDHIINALNTQPKGKNYQIKRPNCIYFLHKTLYHYRHKKLKGPD